MSKTNETSNLDHATLEDHGALADSKLDAVTGGFQLVGGDVATRLKYAARMWFLEQYHYDFARP